MRRSISLASTILALCMTSQCEAFVASPHHRTVAPTTQFVLPRQPTATSEHRPSRAVSLSMSFKEMDQTDDEDKLVAKVAVLFSQGSVTYKRVSTPAERRAMQVYTFIRVVAPSIFIGIASTLLFPALSMALASAMNDAGVFTVLSTDSSQFVQNFLNVASLLFSILIGQTYSFMYQQTENVYHALFNEVTEAKSLLEQVALVCQGRQMYRKCLENISQYVQEDLKRLTADPAVLLSARPSEDPLESIMYMTSVGVPSTVYETVKSLRQARAGRLGALQRKLPAAHMWLLWVLAAIELISFPLLGAGTQVIGGYRVLTVEGILFGVMTGGIVLTLRVVSELWRPAGGAYNVDSVLTTMIQGLEDELEARMAGKTVFKAAQNAPSSLKTTPSGNTFSMSQGQTLQQGGDVFQIVRRLYRLVRQLRSR